VVVDMGQSARFSFSTPYFDSGQVLVVGPDNVDLSGMKGLSGQVLAVELGSNADIVARRWARRRADMVLLHTDSTDGVLAAVASGQADAAIIDRATALMALKTANQRTTTEPKTSGPERRDATNLTIIDERVTDEQYAVVVRKESATLLRAVNAALAEMRRDGTLGELQRKWLGP
jgi:ABC-type amino acid transport substrate-binding protein